MGKIEFKEFVQKNPSLYKYVKNNQMTWQKFYEIFDLYGSDNSVWDDYLKKEEIVKTATTSSIMTEFINWVRNMNLDELQDGLNSVGRVISVLQDFGTKEQKTETTYKPRPVYKHFED